MDHSSKSADVLAAPGSVAKIGFEATPTGGFCRSFGDQTRPFLSEVADKAAALEELLMEIIQSVQDKRTSAMAVAALALASQIGWIA
ncbi:MAG TPA: hypothetical protein VE029_02645 [Rhizobacter sp.]|nr:hypothetical protein [Rhizobacter sp.]